MISIDTFNIENIAKELLQLYEILRGTTYEEQRKILVERIKKLNLAADKKLYLNKDNRITYDTIMCGGKNPFLYFMINVSGTKQSQPALLKAYEWDRDPLFIVEIETEYKQKAVDFLTAKSNVIIGGSGYFNTKTCRVEYYSEIKQEVIDILTQLEKNYYGE